MTDPERRCPTCGAPLVDELRMRDPASDVPVLLWPCEQQHGWLPSIVHGLTAIDPATMPGKQAMTTVDESDRSYLAPPGSGSGGVGSCPGGSATTGPRQPSTYWSYARSTARMKSSQDSSWGLHGRQVNILGPSSGRASWRISATASCLCIIIESIYSARHATA
jgi:hypothetical protein